MIVVDTNVIAYLWINGPHTANAEALLQQDPDWVAPLLWRSEFQNILATYIRSKRLTLPDALLLMKQVNLHMQDRSRSVASEQVLALAEQSSCSAYDCEFVALSMDLKIPLITSDKAILAAFPEIAQSLLSFNKH